MFYWRLVSPEGLSQIGSGSSTSQEGMSQQVAALLATMPVSQSNAHTRPYQLNIIYE